MPEHKAVIALYMGKQRPEGQRLAPKPVVVRALPGTVAPGSLPRALSKVVAAAVRVLSHREISSRPRS